MYARESFTIAEVADLLSIRRLSDSYQDEFPVECPFCGDLRGKCSFCICKNGELKMFTIAIIAEHPETC